MLAWAGVELRIRAVALPSLDHVGLSASGDEVGAVLDLLHVEGEGTPCAAGVNVDSVRR